MQTKETQQIKDLLQMRDEIEKKLFSMSEYTAHRGMVGWLRKETGKPDYIYGEITGYFLSFCGQLYRNTDDEAKENELRHVIASHVAWLEESADRGLKTRELCSDESKEWRNECLFSFDISMILRGLCDVKEWTDTAAVSGKYLEILSGFVDPHRRLIAIDAASNPVIPKKWSTTFDVHLAKAAADLYGLPGWDSDISMNTWHALEHLTWRELAEKDTHPVLYYMEGILLLGAKGALQEDAAYAMVAAYYRQMLKNNQKLMNHLTDWAYYRADVLAQAVRIGSILYARGCLTGDEFRTVEGYLRCLLQDFYEDGYICFYEKNTPGNFYNAWCGMFAWQAIDLYGKAVARKAANRAEADPAGENPENTEETDALWPGILF